jgi:diphthamide biosynthesis methyltransferase
LDIKAEQNKMMPAKDAIEILEKIEMKRNLKIIKNSRLVVIAGAGSAKQIIISGNSEKMKKEKIDVFPQSLIVCGKLNEKENEALAAMCEKGN